MTKLYLTKLVEFNFQFVIIFFISFFAYILYYTYLSVYLSIYLSLYLSIYLSISYIYIYIYIYIYSIFNNQNYLQIGGLAQGPHMSCSYADIGMVDVHSKPTDTFTYVLLTTCYPRESINNIPHNIVRRLRRTCNSDEKFKNRSEEYKNCLITRDYHPGLYTNNSRKLKRCLDIMLERKI